MRVYIIRHGQSENNLKSLYTGQCDVPLTEKGKEDARQAGELLKGVAFDKIYASDLSRAIETAKIALPDCNPVTDKRIREIDVGTLENRSVSTLTAEEFQNVLQNGYGAVGGESMEELYQRVEQFKAELVQSGETSVAIFTHAGWLKGMLDTVLGVRLPRKSVLCNNCTVAIFEYVGENWRLHSWINMK